MNNSKVDLIKEKRTSLVGFIHDQVLGPGGCGTNFGVLDDDQKETTGEEVLNTTPGSIYSSGILFPDKKRGLFADDADAKSNADDDQAEEETPVEDDEGSVLEKVKEDATAKDEDGDINTFSRLYPNKMGISCCLAPSANVTGDLAITVSGRYYTKIANKARIFVRIDKDDQESFGPLFSDANFQKIISAYFAYAEGKLCYKQALGKEVPKTLEESLRKYDQEVCRIIATNANGSLDPIYDDKYVKESVRFLSVYKNNLFKKLMRVNSGTYLPQEQVVAMKERIKKIERYQTFLSYFHDLLGIYKKDSYGFWLSHTFSKTLDISSLDFNFKPGERKKIFLSSDYPCLKVLEIKLPKDLTLSLSANVEAYLGQEGKVYLKVLLVNTSTPVAVTEKKYYSIVAEMVNNRAFFGAQIEMRSEHLVPYQDETDISEFDKEGQRLRYLYRKTQDYGVGHFCSVGWHKEGNAVTLTTNFMPMMDTPDVEPVPRDARRAVQQEDGSWVPQRFLETDECLRFKWLSTLSDTADREIVRGLLDFIETYHKWIEELDTEGDANGEANKSACLRDYQRMKNNIEEFLTDAQKMLHFRLMNTAMFMQLWNNANHKKLVDDKKETTEQYYKVEADDTMIFKGVHAAWRPFQLAFILLNLDGIYQSESDPTWSRRNDYVDLVWFPTGGGKTEAYLGIIALTIIKRRMTARHGEGYGVAVIMRYTLRLLTTQQFQRAMRLILALEQIRRWGDRRYNLGEEEISIGLYVGDSSLPNTYEKQADEINNNWTEESHGKIPLDKCPWCGSSIDYREIRSGKFAFYCTNRKCTFSNRHDYPVRLCDDHVHDNPPTLLFGTVDKFAQLARKVDSKNTAKDSRRIFGVGIGCLPPELIIQDELHLLLGPLGSAVALYENAIDELCKNPKTGVRPKVISSTATTRNTKYQIGALYDRFVDIFPKNGTDYDDSFFAFYKRRKETEDGPWEYVSKRRYLGIMPTGRTLMTTQMRMAAILFVHRAIFEKAHLQELEDEDFIKAADYYFTVISYFNSLKDVGRTDAQFYMEFTKYTIRLFNRVLRKSGMLDLFYANADLFKKSELTGRLTGAEAVKALDKAQSVTWDPKKRLPFPNEDGNYHYPVVPDDFIIATNMISVGLDVSRFNTIMMNSMPRNIAEYIQASSRVARDKEGLVITLHNPFNARDVSHFEKFREFHEKLYYYVEPISITPFSKKAIEKYLPLYMTTVIRHHYEKLGSRTDAKNITSEMAEQIKYEIVSKFSERLKGEVNQSLKIMSPQGLKDIEAKIDRCMAQWLSKKDKSLVYDEAPRATDETALLSSPDDYKDIKKESEWVVPSSLRIVEPDGAIHIK